MKSQSDENAPKIPPKVIQGPNRDFIYIGIASTLLLTTLAAFRQNLGGLSENLAVILLASVWVGACVIFYVYRRWQETRLELASWSSKVEFYETREERLRQKSGNDYQARIEQIPFLGTWKLDIKTNRLTWSDDVFAILGLDIKDGFLTYEEYLKRIHPLDRPVVEEAVSECLRERRPYAIDYRIVTTDGDVRIVFEQNQPVNIKGDPVVIRGTIIDATEKKLSETALRAQYGMLQFLIDAIPVPVFHKNANGIFESCNKAYEDFIGVPKIDIVGNTVYDFLPEDQAIEADNADQSLIRFGCSLTYEAMEIDGNGDVHNVIYYKTPLSVPDGSPGGIIAAMLDISERKKMEAALRVSEERHRNFAADVAHELRTPLAVLRTNLDNFGDTENVKSLRLDVDSMSRMVTQLLAATRLEIHAAPDLFVDVNLADVCRHVATLLGPIAIKEQRSIEVLGGEKPIIIQGIFDSLEQAVRNLAENAIRYSSRGSVISFTLGYDDGAAFIRVIDRGRGIAKEQREAIFERFLRADRRAGGAGLGLSIVKRTVENHKAEIDIEDTPGGGATFIIRFPKRDATLPVSRRRDDPRS